METKKILLFGGFQPVNLLEYDSKGTTSHLISSFLSSFSSLSRFLHGMVAKRWPFQKESGGGLSPFADGVWGQTPSRQTFFVK
jgi:hypothetical protein